MRRIWRRHVGLEGVEVEQHDVRQVADGPPGPDVLPERPERMAVAVEPVEEVVPHRRRWRLDRRTDPAGRLVQRLVPFGVRVDVVVVHAPHHVAAVAPDVEVFRLRREHERVHREMRLQEAAMRLRLDGGQLLRLRRHAQVEPRRHLRHLEILATVEQELGDDLLGPGRARLGVGGDDDVVVAEAEVVPDGGVEVVVVQLARLLRPLDRWRHCPAFTTTVRGLPGAPEGGVDRRSQRPGYTRCAYVTIRRQR